MRLHRRPELRHSSGRRYVDTFAAVSPLWTLRAGTLAAGLQAATQADWLGDMVSNGNMETGNPPTGWGAVLGGTPTGAADERTGGVGVQSLDVVRGTSNFSVSTVTVAAVVGATGVLGGWRRSTAGDYIGLGVYTSGTARMFQMSITDSAVWIYDTATGQFTNTSPRVYGVVMDAVGSGRFDDISLYRQNTVATLNWGSPNIQITLDLLQPAAPSVVPFSAIVRYTDTLNYWEVRVLPNTAGTDLQIVEVVAGVETVRASADVDWTAGGTDQMRINVYGTTTAVEVKKSGAPAFTAACSYATMATGAAARDHGLMFYGTGVNRCTRWLSC